MCRMEADEGGLVGCKTVTVSKKEKVGETKVD